MKTVAIEEAFDFVRNGLSVKQEDGKTGIPITRIETIWNSNIDKDRFGYADITEEKLKDIERYLLNEGDILMTHINSPKHLGKCAIYNNEPEKLIHGMNLLCLRPNAEILFPKYAMYFFNSGRFRSIIPRISNQSVNQASFSAGNLKEIQIPLPPLPLQQKIAAILDAADAYRQKTNALIDKYDQLAQSLFLDMFGDPVRNEKGWKKDNGANYSEKISVGVVVKPASYYVEKGVIALRSLNIRPQKFDLNDLVFFSEESHSNTLSKSILRKGDVVIVRTGSTGTAAVVPEELDGCNCIDLIILSPKLSTINPFYLAYFFNSERGKQIVSGKEVGGIQKHFNIGTINNLKIPIPPIALQNQFAEHIQLIESQKQQAQSSLQKAEDLFNSLLQKAFNGELVG